jgi:hypothetical protein
MRLTVRGWLSTMAPTVIDGARVGMAARPRDSRASPLLVLQWPISAIGAPLAALTRDRIKLNCTMSPILGWDKDGVSVSIAGAVRWIAEAGVAGNNDASGTVGRRAKMLEAGVAMLVPLGNAVGNGRDHGGGSTVVL